MTNLTRNAKAVVAFFAPFLTDLAAKLQSGSHLTYSAVAHDCIIYLLGAFVVWAVPNTP